jgi:hypothetical protein
MMSWLIRFFFKWSFPLFKWIESSFTGKDGRSSGRKISAFAFMVLIISTTSKILMKDNPTMIHVYLLCVLVTTFLLLQGIITVQNIVDLWKNGNPNDPKPSDNGGVEQPGK